MLKRYLIVINTILRQSGKKFYLYLKLSKTVLNLHIVTILLLILYFRSFLSNPSNVIVGRLGDATNSYIPWLEATRLNNKFRVSIFESETNYFSFPFGEKIWNTTEIVSLVPRIFLYCLTLITKSSIISQNLLIFCLFILNYSIFYLLMKRLKINNQIAIIFAILFTFSNYHQAKVADHLSLLNSWIIVLTFYFCINILYQKSSKDFLFINLLFLIVFYIETYYVLMILSIIVPTLFIISKDLIKNKSQHTASFKKILLFTLINFIFLLPLIYVYFFKKNNISGSFRSNQDLLGFSAKFEYLLIPYPNNLNLKFLSKYFSSANEMLAGLESVHFNLLPIVIIVIGLTYFLAKQQNFFLSKSIRIYLIFIYSLVLSLLLIIPIDLKLFNLKFNSPYFFFYQIFPHWRATARFLELFNTIILIISAIIINKLLRTQSKKIKMIFINLLLFLVLMNIGFNANWGPITTGIGDKMSYYIKNNTSKNAKILYTENLNERYLSHIFQLTHNRPIANNVLNFQSNNPIYQAMSPNDIDTSRIMNFLGIDYLVFTSFNLYYFQDFSQLKLVKTTYDNDSNKYSYLLKPKSSSKIDSFITLEKGFYGTEYKINSGTWSSEMISIIKINTTVLDSERYKIKAFLFSRTPYSDLNIFQSGKLILTTRISNTGTSIEFCALPKIPIVIKSDKQVSLNYNNENQSSDKRKSTYFLTGLTSTKC